MAGGENKISTRNKASHKRPNQAVEGNPATKKRAVLVEITNISSNVHESTQKSRVEKARKPKPESDLDKPGNEVSHVLAGSPGSDELQKYGYAPSMFQYLRSLEVFSRFYVKFCTDFLRVDVLVAFTISFGITMSTILWPLKQSCMVLIIRKQCCDLLMYPEKNACLGVL